MGKSPPLFPVMRDYRDRTLKLYSTARWRKLRERHRRKHPYCQCPAHEGKFVEGEVVDHIRPHRGDTRLFFDPNNLQTLSKHCHNSWKKSEELRDLKGCDADGEPNDPKHPWNQ